MTVRTILLGLLIFALGFFCAAVMALLVSTGAILITEPRAGRVMPASSLLELPAASVAGHFGSAA